MAIDTNSLVYLIDPFWQGENINGKPIAGGWMCVYYAGTDLKYITYQNFDGTQHPFKIPLNNDGRATILVEPQYTYDCYLYDSFGNLVCSRLNVKPVVGGGNIAIKGRTYHGIEPVVVNNQYNLISARNIPLGVQAPLHFVEDSESACIIGFSGDMSDMATKTWVSEQDYMQTEKLEFNENGQVTGFDGSAFAAGYVDPSDFIPWSASGEFQSAGNYATQEDLTGYQEKGNYYSATNPSGFINSDAISGMATQTWVSEQGYLTEHDGLMSASLLGISDNKITGYNGSAFAGSELDEYELSACNGISINNDPINQKTIISVSGDYATNSDLQTVSGEITALIPTAITGDYLDKASADTLYYSIDNPSGFITGVPADMATTGDISDLAQSISETYQPIGNYQTAGDYYSATNPSGFITGVDLTPYQLTADMTAYQPVGDYLTTADSGEFYTTANESGFITGVDLTPYQTTAGMTAYQPAGDYLTTADSANFYTTANESGFITGVDLAPYQTTAGMTAYQTTAGMSNYATTGDLDYVSGVVGNVESLLASL